MSVKDLQDTIKPGSVQPKMKISLHLGAHKTATTYLQQVLRRNIDYLAERRVLYVPLKDVREGFTWHAAMPVKKPFKHFKRFKARRKTKKYLKSKLAVPEVSDLSPYRRFILSDENLIGSPSRIVRSGLLYSRAEKHLNELRQHLSGHMLDIFFAIRQQGAFASSIFAESMSQDNLYVYDDAEFKQAWVNNQPSWIPVISSITEAFPKANIYIWDFEKFAQIEGEIFSLLADADDLLDIKRLTKPTRQSLSQKTVELLLEAQAKGGSKARIKHRREFRLAYPRNEVNKAFSLWSNVEQDSFTPRFQNDLEIISQLSPKVQLLTSLD